MILISVLIVTVSILVFNSVLIKFKPKCCEWITKPNHNARDTDFIKSLKTPLFLNFASGIFALERAYQTLSISQLQNPQFGHLYVILLYFLGFACGFFEKWKPASYLFLISGSCLLLAVLVGDIVAVRENSCKSQSICKNNNCENKDGKIEHCKTKTVPKSACSCINSPNKSRPAKAHCILKEEWGCYEQNEPSWICSV